MAGSARGLRPTASDLDRAAGAPDPGKPPRTGQRGLDWFNFFVADIQTGFGPFLSVYLTTQKWTQVDIGLVLSIGSIAGLLAQVPGGWVVDLARSKLRAAGLAVIAIGLSALLIALAPSFVAMVAAKLLHVGASSVLGPAIAAITLGLVGHAAVAARLGRNARFCRDRQRTGGRGDGRVRLFHIRAGRVSRDGRTGDTDPARAAAAFPRPPSIPSERTAATARRPRRGAMSVTSASRACCANRGCWSSRLCILLFHLANAAMLPLVGSDVTMRSSRWATALVAACIIAPQLVVAAISPKVGELAQDWGRRPLLLIGFGVLPLRGALLAWTSDPYMIVAVQALDGLSGAVLGVLVPLTLADVSRGTGRFNLAQGIVGSATGVGAALSTIGAGYLADKLGTSIAFAGLAAVAVLAFAAVALLMPETRSVPRQDGKA